MNHVDESLLNEYLDDALQEEKVRTVEAHLAACQSCRQLLNELQIVFAALDEVIDIPLTTDLFSPVRAEIQGRNASMSTRLRLALAAQAAAAVALLIWLWPPIRLWLQGASQVIADTAVRLRWPLPLTLGKGFVQVSAIIDWFHNARPALDMAIDQWGMLLIMALIVWLVGNRLLLTANSNGGTNE